MTPKEKAIKWMDNYTDKVKITKEDVEESVDIALRIQAKEILEIINKFIDILDKDGTRMSFLHVCQLKETIQRYLHNPVKKRGKKNE